jgi:hypothetical protein
MPRLVQRPWPGSSRPRLLLASLFVAGCAGLRGRPSAPVDPMCRPALRSPTSAGVNRSSVERRPVSPFCVHELAPIEQCFAQSCMPAALRIRALAGGTVQPPCILSQFGQHFGEPFPRDQVLAAPAFAADCAAGVAGGTSPKRQRGAVNGGRDTRPRISRVIAPGPRRSPELCGRAANPLQTLPPARPSGRGGHAPKNGGLSRYRRVPPALPPPRPPLV